MSNANDAETTELEDLLKKVLSNEYGRALVIAGFCKLPASERADTLTKLRQAQDVLTTTFDALRSVLTLDEVEDVVSRVFGEGMQQVVRDATARRRQFEQILGRKVSDEDNDG